MKITESVVKMSSQHAAVSKTQERETLEAWVDGKQGVKAGTDAVKVDVSHWQKNCSKRRQERKLRRKSQIHLK